MTLALALALAVQAPTAGLRLDWEAPAGCPDAAGLRARVSAMLGEATLARADLQATAKVRADGEGWALELELVRAAGRDRRALADRDCAALTDAAALMIAVAIDPQALPPVEVPVPEDSPPGAPGVIPAPPVEAPVPEDRPVVDPPVPEDRPVEAPVPEDRPVPPATEPVPEDRPAPPRRLQLGLRVGAGLGFTRILPGLHAALELGLGLEGRGWRAELAGTFAPPVRGAAAADPAIGGVFRLGAGELRGCGVPALRAAPLSFPLCAGLQVGAMHGRGEGGGLQVKQTARSLWIAARLGGALRWRPRGGRVGLWLGLDLIVALTRPTFETAGAVQVHRAARVGGQASVGIEIRLR